MDKGFSTVADLEGALAEVFGCRLQASPEPFPLTRMA
jgi:hypothetical protein